jgi:hypothetical protein
MMEKKSISPLRRVLPISLSLLLAVALLAVTIIPGQAYSVPLISIVSVDKDVSVTISGAYFPPNKTFTVRMGPYGSLGIGGEVVGTYDSNDGSSFTRTYDIPDSLVGSAKIAIRMDSPDGFYSFNWFVNDASKEPTPAPAGYHGYPTFDITAVVAGSSVTILTHNMPAGQSFTVRMGEYGTYAQNGIVVGSTGDSGGSFSATYAIPSELAGKNRIAIRLDGPTGLYAYNWFYNNDAPVAGNTPVPGATPVPGYYGYPYIYIASVVQDSKVTIYAYNFPAGQTFIVRMGDYGTYGIGGIQVATVDTGSGGNFTATYDIPGALVGRSQISIRLETSNGYYNAYNWFYNNTTY